METLQKGTLILTIIGTINWLLIGIFRLNLVTLLFGEESILTMITYIIIGICGLIDLSILFCHIEK